MGSEAVCFSFMLQLEDTYSTIHTLPDTVSLMKENFPSSLLIFHPRQPLLALPLIGIMPVYFSLTAMLPPHTYLTHTG